MSDRFDADLRAQVLKALDNVFDPCSIAAGTPLGLVEMGMVESVAVSGTHVDVELLPTFFGCMLVGVFTRAARDAISALPGVSTVDVSQVRGGLQWSELRMTSKARALLGRTRNSAYPVQPPVPTDLLDTEHNSRASG